MLSDAGTGDALFAAEGERLCNRSRGHCGVDVEKEVYELELQSSMRLLLGGEPPWDDTDIINRI